MFIDTADLTSDTIVADLAVFGAGPSGISLARALAARRMNVALFESGGFHVDPERQGLFDGVSIGEHMLPEQGRYRVFGGAGTRWTGRCAKLDPIDFERRNWVADSGWPIEYEELLAYYPEAASLCGFPPNWEAVPGWFADLSRQRPDPGGAIMPFIWHFFKTGRARYRDFGRDNFEELRTNPNLYVFTNVDIVDVTPHHHQITSACLRDRAGRQLRVKAGGYVLACGGIENTRLLMNFARNHRPAFGQIQDSIGRRFMQHPRTVTARIEANPRQAIALQQRFNNFGQVGQHFESGFALSPEAQRRHGLVNASAVLRYSSSFWNLCQDMMRRPVQTLDALRLRATGRVGPLSCDNILLHVDLEQVPDPESRLLLSEKRDALGLNRIVVDWRISPVERETSAFFTRSIGEWLSKAGLGKPVYAQGLDETGALVSDRLQESYHHIGGTRMSETPRTGVVDRNLKVHGLSNLYLAGSSVMPTGGHANPTLTILCLTLRLAQHINAAILAGIL